MIPRIFENRTEFPVGRSNGPSGLKSSLMPPQPNTARTMRALSIRQPHAELILRGIKTAELRAIETVEYRTWATRIIGERFHIYAGKAAGKPVWSRDLAMPATGCPNGCWNCPSRCEWSSRGRAARSAVVDQATQPAFTLASAGVGAAMAPTAESSASVS
jgi:hypothetical protein